MNTTDREKLLKILDSIGGLAEILEDDIDRRAHLDTEPFLNDATATSIVVAIKQQASKGYELADDTEY